MVEDSFLICVQSDDLRTLIVHDFQNPPLASIVTILESLYMLYIQVLKIAFKTLQPRSGSPYAPCRIPIQYLTVLPCNMHLFHTISNILQYLATKVFL